MILGHYEKEYLPNDAVTDGVYAFENGRTFGFRSGDMIILVDGKPVVRYQDALPKYTNAYLSGKVVNRIDAGTHTLFLAEVTESVHLSDDPSLTYAWYHENIKPKPAMPSAQGEGKTRWVCQTCGYVYEGDEMPDDFVCPWCKHGKADFVKMENQ